jgi:NADPH2:quinone reductase
MGERLMRAVRVHAFGGPEALRCEDVPVPVPQGSQVLVKVEAAGVNPVDTYIRTGAYARKPALPYTPGSDAAGTVAALGAEAEGLAVGDRVYTSGTLSGSYAEYALCERTQVYPLPTAVDFAQGAALGTPYATAYRALFQRGSARPGEKLLIHGATGGVGLAALQLAVAAGMRIFATGGTAEGRALVREQGAHAVFDHHAEGYLDEIGARSGGVDIVLEMLANVNLDRDLTVLSAGGRVVVVGSRGRIEIDPRATMQRETAIIGMTLFAATPREVAEIHAALGAGLANGSLRPVIGKRFSLADAGKAHEAITQTGTCGKIIIHL